MPRVGGPIAGPIMGAGSASESWVHGFGLHREDTEDALVDAPHRFACNGSSNGFESECALPQRHRRLLASIDRWIEA